MKVVINKCYGGFSLSPKAVRVLAERKGKPCFFFMGPERKPASEEQAAGELFWNAYTVPNPDEVAISQANWKSMSLTERRESNESWNAITLESRPRDRTDPDLIAVVEMLGDEASGECANLKVVEIPDGVEWEIGEYDGLEEVREAHRTWS